MRIFVGGATNTNYSPDLKLNTLESYFFVSRKELKIDPTYIKEFFLDSGAFSAWSQKKVINLRGYIDYIKRNFNKIDYYSNLDEIYNSKKSAENLAIMEAQGLKPIPVYHYGESFKIFKDLCSKYDFIALGGMVPISTKNLIPFLNDCFEYICNKDGNTNKKIHGFGMTTLELMKKYPWFSVDSISPIITGAMGGIYNSHGQVISVARKKDIPPSTKIYLGEEQDWLSLTKIEKNPLIDDFTFEDIRNKYKVRIIINLRYIMKLEKELTENPPKYINNQSKLF